MRIAIIGDGGWGTANAVLLAGYGHEVVVWGHSAEHVAEIARTRENARYLPGVEIPAAIRWETDPARAVANAEYCVFAVPSEHLTNIAAAFRGLLAPHARIVSLVKGFCGRTHRRMSEILAAEFPEHRVVVLSGPSHAEEVARGIPTALTAAAQDIADAQAVQAVWSGPRMRVYSSDDPIGVEAGGALKNVLAIAVGCSDGLGFGDNTRAALITRGLAELVRFASACGAKRASTVSGLSGTGDLIVTCTSRHSRNRGVGERLGRGEKMADILGSMRMVAEGVVNARVIREIAVERGVEMPIAEAVFRICHEGLPVSEALVAIMNRPVKNEAPFV